MSLPKRSYWSYLIHSKGRHGVHSPFVFQLADSCLTAKVDKNFQTERKKWYRLLVSDMATFPVTDHGAGSHVLNQKRSVGELFKTSSSKGIYGDLLYKLARYFKPQTVLELGTSIGVGTVHLKMGYPKNHLFTVEGCDNTLRQGMQSFDYWKLDGIATFRSTFDEFLSQPSFQQYDLIFIDGHHDGKATLDYLERLQDQSHDETLFIFDDIRWSDDMWEAWEQIRKDERFHVTIDLGRMGLVWRRPQQTKEHFVLRPVIWKNLFF